ncbi:MAG TPA: hypothetical protein VK982_03955 [Bacteroidales bacterium]|nr:hypothetical protein [Bacteroidales bacterium]
MELRILIETRFINPLLGGQIQTTIKEYKMEDGNAAEIYYNKELNRARQNKGCEDVSISIVTKAK